MDIKEITSTADLDINDEEFGEPTENMTATNISDPESKIEFHVQMRSYTMRDMEALVVDAAARMIVGKHGDGKLAKLIEERCVVLITQKIDAHLAKVTDAIIDQPLTPSFGDKKPVTMREFIGLYPREYLEQHVDRDGKPSKPDSWSQTRPRFEALVSKAIDSKFKAEIEKASNAAISQVQTAIRNRHNELIVAEKKRMAEYFAKAVAP